MEKVLDKVLAIIDRHMSEYTQCMVGIVTYELDMVESDCALSKSEAERLDRKWQDTFERRAELLSLREEILQSVVIQ